LEKHEIFEKYNKINEYMMWRKQNPTLDDFRMLEKLREARGNMRV